MRKLLGLLERHRAHRLLVALVADEQLDRLLPAVVVHVFHPADQVFKRLRVRHVVHEHHAVRPAIVGGCERAEALLPGGVPQLQVDRLGVHLHLKRLEVDADRRLVRLRVRVLDESHDQAGLANSRIAYAQQLKRRVVRAALRRFGQERRVELLLGICRDVPEEPRVLVTRSRLDDAKAKIERGRVGGCASVAEEGRAGVRDEGVAFDRVVLPLQLGRLEDVGAVHIVVIREQPVVDLAAEDEQVLAAQRGGVEAARRRLGARASAARRGLRPRHRVDVKHVQAHGQERLCGLVGRDLRVGCAMLALRLCAVAAAEEEDLARGEPRRRMSEARRGRCPACLHLAPLHRLAVEGVLVVERHVLVIAPAKDEHAHPALALGDGRGGVLVSRARHRALCARLLHPLEGLEVEGVQLVLALRVPLCLAALVARKGERDRGLGRAGLEAERRMARCHAAENDQLRRPLRHRRVPKARRGQVAGRFGLHPRAHLHVEHVHVTERAVRAFAAVHDQPLGHGVRRVQVARRWHLARRRSRVATHLDVLLRLVGRVVHLARRALRPRHIGEVLRHWRRARDRRA
mmetsp:Transcript_10715/g.33796  ORF Transcript_10715/g.33796 Transcript_10715/m.33796 type:complete len:575 (-) Transcript_10715:87-1811(-)